MNTQDRTIRDVKIGDILDMGYDCEIIDIGKNGVISQYETYYTFEELEKHEIKLKQPEKQEIDKLGDFNGKHGADFWEIKDKLNEVIEEVNKLLEK